MFVCIASANPVDYEIILNTSIFSSVGLNCGKIIHSGNDLVKLIANDRTEILIIDTELEDADLFESINIIKSQKPLQVILIAPRRDFSYAYRAMKASACELLVRPYTSEQIANALLEAAHRIRSDSQSTLTQNTNSRNAFAEELSAVLGNKTISGINRSFHTTFHEGLFRVVSFAIDFPNINQIQDIAEQIWHSTQSFLYTHAWFNTYDIVHSIVYNELRIIFNYAEFEDDAVMRMLPSMFRYTQDTCRSSPGLELFMGIGQAYKDINKLTVSFEESKNGIWMRMASRYPKNRIITYTNSAISDKQSLAILALSRDIISAIDTLNTPAFIKAVNKFFAFPVEVLCSAQAKQAILDTVRYFREQYKESLDKIDNAYSFYHRTKMSLLTSQTFDEYKRRYVRIFTDKFERLHMDLEKNKANNYISRVKSMIDKRYMENLTLDKIAQEIDISPNYLSRIFHMETGKTFSDYLLDRRLSVAQVFLEKSDYNIKEVSSAVGYSDQRYFSRVFIKKLGLTPTEYRTIHKKTTSQ